MAQWYDCGHRKRNPFLSCNTPPFLPAHWVHGTSLARAPPSRPHPRRRHPALHRQSSLRPDHTRAPPPRRHKSLSAMLADLHITLPPDTVDTIKAGDPSTPVTGIATTFLPTFAVLQQAVAHGDNLIITHEPSFYNHRDATAFLATDPVYQQKRAYIDQHHLVLFRLHDGWHLRQPDGIVEGWVAEAGWQRFATPATCPPSPSRPLPCRPSPSPCRRPLAPASSASSATRTFPSPTSPTCPAPAASSPDRRPRTP